MSAFLLYSKQSSLAPMLPLLKMQSGSVIPREDLDIVIQWGAGLFSSQDPSIHVLNGAEGIANAANRKSMLEMLKWNGISTVESTPYSPRVSTIRRYFIPVFQQQELALFRSRGRKVWLTNEISSDDTDTYEEMEINRSLREIRRVLRLAVRSIFSLGLDFGGVLIGIGLNGAMNVIDVTPTPRINKSLAEKFSKAFEEYIDLFQKGVPQPVTLGADPEFVLRNKVTGKMVLASRFFGKKGRVGCDDIWIRSDQTKTQLPLVELRPLPTNDPRQLTINLYKAMLLADKKINNSSIEWLAGGMPLKNYPIGGHIHFSQTWINSTFLRALDSYLALPLMLVENDHSLSRRPKYGFIGDFRKQFHGGFEYRTLPSWLVSPRVTKGIIALAKLIAENYTQLHEFPTLSPAIQKAFYQGDKKRILSSVKSIWPQLEKLKSYEKYEKYITPFRDMAFQLQEWDEFQDIRPSWRIPPTSVKNTISNMI